VHGSSLLGILDPLACHHQIRESCRNETEQAGQGYGDEAIHAVRAVFHSVADLLIIPVLSLPHDVGEYLLRKLCLAWPYFFSAPLQMHTSAKR